MYSLYSMLPSKQIVSAALLHAQSQNSALIAFVAVQVAGYVLSALAKVHAQARLPLGEGFEQLLHDAASSHNADLQLRAVQIQAMFE